MCREHIEGDERGTYVALGRSAPPERGMAYRARAPRSRSPHSSLGWGKPTTWRRGTGGRHMNGGRVRDAHRPEPKCMSSTGELIDIERVTISLEGAVIRSPETWSDPRGWEPKVHGEPLRTCWACGCGLLSNSHPQGA